MGGPPGPPFSHPGPSCRNPAAGMPAKFCNQICGGTFRPGRRPGRAGQLAGGKDFPRPPNRKRGNLESHFIEARNLVIGFAEGRKPRKRCLQGGRKFPLEPHRVELIWKRLKGWRRRHAHFIIMAVKRPDEQPRNLRRVCFGPEP